MPAKKKPVAAKPAQETGELVLIRKLADILNETGLTEIELDHKGARVRVSKASYGAGPVAHFAAAPAPGVHTAAVAAPVIVAAPAEAAGTPLKSPMVGTAYLSPTPGQPAFAALGSMVKEGQTLLIIEAMKTMNQIAAPKSGKLIQVNIENAQPVEFGEVLMVIE
ncbi:MAG: acetyl-CoA carboxylase biotin carboxyl carrier protein [Aestuariivirga sp.]